MKSSSSSHIRADSPFAVPPRVRFISDAEHMTEVIALAGALEECGADADVRFLSDFQEREPVKPDVYVLEESLHTPHPMGPVMFGLRDPNHPGMPNAGFDLLIERPVEPRALMQLIGDWIDRRRGTSFA